MHRQEQPDLSRMTQLYGPAVRCKLNLQNGWSCASVYGPCVEQITPGHHGYPRAFGLILRSALEGQLGHQITNATARPFSIFQIQLADLGGCLLLLSGALGLTGAIPSEPPSLARPDRRATVAEKGGGHPFGEPERAHIAATLRRASYSRCCTSTLHAMRASLLARAVASTLWCNR